MAPKMAAIDVTYECAGLNVATGDEQHSLSRETRIPSSVAISSPLQVAGDYYYVYVLETTVTSPSDSPSPPMARTKTTARRCTGEDAPRKQISSISGSTRAR